MTIALCMHCGSIKHGAYLECPQCGEGPTGVDDVDLLLTDHYFEKQELQRLGELWKQILMNSSDLDHSYYAFFYLLNRYHPDQVSVDIPEELREPVFELLEEVNVEAAMDSE